jgi:hypothetical protein
LQWCFVPENGYNVVVAVVMVRIRAASIDSSLFADGAKGGDVGARAGEHTSIREHHDGGVASFWMLHGITGRLADASVCCWPFGYSGLMHSRGDAYLVVLCNVMLRIFLEVKV